MSMPLSDARNKGKKGCDSQEHLQRLSERVRRVSRKVVERVPQPCLSQHLQRRARHPPIHVEDTARTVRREAGRHRLADIASNAVEDVRHVAEVGRGENRVEELALSPMLLALARQHAWPEKHRKVAVLLLSGKCAELEGRGRTSMG